MVGLRNQARGADSARDSIAKNRTSKARRGHRFSSKAPVDYEKTWSRCSKCFSFLFWSLLSHEARTIYPRASLQLCRSRRRGRFSTPTLGSPSAHTQSTGRCTQFRVGFGGAVRCFFTQNQRIRIVQRAIDNNVLFNVCIQPTVNAPVSLCLVIYMRQVVS